MLSIGTFSRATHVSIRALRRYHEQGLLVPAEVDPVTGYRSYRREQILDAQLIRRLRDLDLPLAAVGHIVDSRDPALTAKVLAEHRFALEERRADLDRMLTDLAGLLDGSASLDVGSVHVRQQRAEPVIVLQGRTPESDFRAFFGRAFARLGAHAARHGLTVTGPGGARFPDRQWDGDDVEVEAFLPVRDPVAVGTVQAARLPAGRLAVVLHAGGYDGIDDAHAALGDWAAANGVEPAGSLQELYLVSPGDTADPAAWRTEVGWLVRNEEEPL
ncbi:MAG: MerR family transcriptional regulator [Geodermatophilaceae bacterium]|jgi:DNA-binding transcriptional MerR regulator|nr:MerR family transcriptional regulator [Geodermatophilaceae bacterium]